MKIRKINNKTIDYLFVFFLIVYAGGATQFVREIYHWDNMIGVFFPILVAFLYMVYFKIPVRKVFIYFMLGFFFYIALVSLKFSIFNPRFIGTWIINLFITYVALYRIKSDFFKIYEDILYGLSIIGLIMWVVYIASPGITRGVLAALSVGEPGAQNVDSTILIYTLGTIKAQGEFFLPRNAGYAWEPGAFASFVSLALLINLIRNRFSILRNRRLWIFVFALISTFSTTGFAILIILIIFIIYNLSPKIGLVFFPAALVLILFILQLPFMMEKIEELTEFNIEKKIRLSAITGNAYTAQRFESLVIQYRDFLNNPILGYGGYMQSSWTAQRGATIYPISGIGNIMARFGIVGIIFIFYSLYRSSRALQEIYPFKGWIFPVLVIIAISISYNVEMPLFLCFWLFYLFGESINKKQVETVTELPEYELHYR